MKLANFLRHCNPRRLAPGLWLGIFLVLAGLFASTYLYWQSLSEFVDSTRDQILRVDLAKAFAAELKHSVQKHSEESAITSVAPEEAFLSLARHYTELLPEIDIYLLDNTARVIFSYCRSYQPKDLKQVSLIPIQKFLQTSHLIQQPILGDNPSEKSYQAIFSVAPYSDGRLNGYVYIILHNRYRRVLEIPLFESGHILGTFGFGLEVLCVLIIVALLLRILFQRMFRQLSAVVGTDAQSLTAPITSVQAFEQALLTLVKGVAEEKSELQLRGSEVSQAIAEISHDLRTPLLHIQDQAERLIAQFQDQTGANPTQHGKTILRSLRSLNHLIAGLEVLDTLGNISGPSGLSECQLEPCIHDILDSFRLHAQELRISLTIDLAESLPPVLASLELLERVFRNLLENALRHTPAGGEILVSAYPIDSSFVKVTIKDTGVGIPESDLASIFEPFRQVQTPSEKDGTVRKNGKSGLGLAICRQIINAHGGILTVESQEGVGTAFSFTLPIADGTKNLHVPFSGS